jgi:hypothetical protein
VVRAVFKDSLIKQPTMKAGREFLEKEKKIRATITVEVPYSNELLNYGYKLDKALREVIDRTEHISCSVVAGELAPSKEPVIR